MHFFPYNYINIFTTSLIRLKVFTMLTIYIEKRSLMILEFTNQAQAIFEFNVYNCLKNDALNRPRRHQHFKIT